VGYKFEKLEVWELALEYVDLFYEMIREFPHIERNNLQTQSIRAATSICLNIAEGSTGQSDAEQNRFLGMAARSLVETVACLHLMKRRGYLEGKVFDEAYGFSEKLFAKLQAFRNHLKSGSDR